MEWRGRESSAEADLQDSGVGILFVVWCVRRGRVQGQRACVCPHLRATLTCGVSLLAFQRLPHTSLEPSASASIGPVKDAVRGRTTATLFFPRLTCLFDAHARNLGALRCLAGGEGE